MLGRYAAAVAAGTLFWFVGEWLGGLLWPGHAVNGFVFAWMVSLAAAVLALVLVGTRQQRSRRAGKR